MSAYKVIFRASANNPEPKKRTQWEPGCPLVFEAIQISRNLETGQAFFQARVRNISCEVVHSFSVSISCTFSDGSMASFDATPLDADIMSTCDYTLTPIELPRGDAASAKARIRSTTTSSGKWESSSKPLPLPERRALHLTDMELEERIFWLRRLGCNKAAEAAPYGVDEREDWAICPCGQISSGLASCPSCGLSLKDSIQWESAEHLAKQSEERKAEKGRQDKEIRLFTRITLAATLLIAVVLIGLSTCNHNQSASPDDSRTTEMQLVNEDSPSSESAGLAETSGYSGSTDDFIHEVDDNLNRLPRDLDLSYTSGKWGITLDNDLIGVIEVDETNRRIGFIVMGDEDTDIGGFGCVIAAALSASDPTISVCNSTANADDILEAIRPLLDEQSLICNGVKFEIEEENDVYTLMVAL